MSYEQKLERFRKLFEEHNNERKNRLYPELPNDTIGVEEGYKFDKVFVIHVTSADGKTQRMGRYMVESRSGAIYGIKAWAQVNRRRQYGTLNTVDQYDWSDFYGRPLPGTKAEFEHTKREDEITSTHKKRGRKSKVVHHYHQNKGK